MSLITIHYRDVNDPGQDINQVPVWGDSGQMFNVEPYVDRLSSDQIPYYFESVAQTTSTFTIQPQNVVIMVRKYQQVTILFKDITDHGNVVGKCRLSASHAGQKLDYVKVGQQHMPSGYEFLMPVQSSLDLEDDHVIVPNATEVVYVQPQINTFDLHQPTHHEQTQAQQPQQPPKPKVTADVLYQNVKTNQVVKAQAVRGEAGQSIKDYVASDSPYLPKGYHYVQFLSNHGDKLVNHAIYVVLIKAVPVRQQRPHMSSWQSQARRATNQVTQLPRVNPGQQDIGAILVALGASLNALGHAMDQRRM